MLTASVPATFLRAALASPVVRAAPDVVAGVFPAAVDRGTETRFAMASWYAQLQDRVRSEARIPICTGATRYRLIGRPTSGTGSSAFAPRGSVLIGRRRYLARPGGKLSNHVITEDINALLLRNVSAKAVLAAAQRLGGDEESRKSANQDSMVYIGAGENVPADFRAAFLSEFRKIMCTFAFDRDQVEWIIGGTPFTPNARADIASAIADMRVISFVDRHADPGMPVKAWIGVRAADAMIDLLIQPFGVLTSLVDRIAQAWVPLTGNEIQLSLQSRMPDRVTAGIEYFLVQSLGISGYTQSRPADIKASPEVDFESTAGFRRVEDIANLPYLSNPLPIVNPGPGTFSDIDDAHGWADPYYGHVFTNRFLTARNAIYEPIRTVEGNYGHLAIPFKTVPRYFVESVDQLKGKIGALAHAIESRKPGRGPVLFRGQTHEYALNRPDGATLALYGKRDAIEPSLLPSSTRRLASDSTYAAFATYLEIALTNRRGLDTAVETVDWATIQGDLTKVAFAQHYGLPTNALDLTVDPRTAMWFASTELTYEDGRFVANPVSEGNICVIYLLWPGRNVGHPIKLPSAALIRPRQQDGWVTPSTWGWRANQAAAEIAAAIYFPGSLRPELLSDLPPTERLFPRQADDLVMMLPAMLASYAQTNPITQEMKENLYRVIPSVAEEQRANQDAAGSSGPSWDVTVEFSGDAPTPSPEI